MEGMICIAAVASVFRNVLEGLSQMVFSCTTGRPFSVTGTTSLLVVIARRQRHQPIHPFAGEQV